MLVGDRQVVERRGVGRVDLDRLFPAVDRLAPETALGDVDAEVDLRLRVLRASANAGDADKQRSRRRKQDARNSDRFTE